MNRFLLNLKFTAETDACSICRPAEIKLWEDSRAMCIILDEDYAEFFASSP